MYLLLLLFLLVLLRSLRLGAVRHDSKVQEEHEIARIHEQPKEGVRTQHVARCDAVILAKIHRLDRDKNSDSHLRGLQGRQDPVERLRILPGRLERHQEVVEI